MDWKLVWMAFTTLFIAEMGDKTQLAVFSMVAQHNRLLPIFLGAALALVTVTAIGALAGGFIQKYLPAPLIQTAAGLLFIVLGAKALVEALPELIRLWIH